MDQFGEESRIPTSTSRKATLASPSPSRSSACSLPASPASNHSPSRSSQGSGSASRSSTSRPTTSTRGRGRKTSIATSSAPRSRSVPQRRPTVVPTRQSATRAGSRTTRRSSPTNERRTSRTSNGVAGAGAIQRADGTMEAFIEIDPDNMDFAMSDDWAQRPGRRRGVRQQGTRLEAQTPRDNPLISGGADYREHRRPPERRGTSKKTRSSGSFEEYRETRPKEMRDRGIQQVRYYIGVQVTPLEVYDRFRDEGRRPRS